MVSFDGVTRVGIWGYGSEGRAAREFFAARAPGAAVTVLIEGEAPQELAADPGVALLTGEDARAAIVSGAFEILVKSPGISLYRPEVAAAKASGTIVTSTTNLWFGEHPTATKLVVTGTKGKSTVSRLIHHLLRSAGRDAALAGNVGIPLLSTAPGGDLTVIELSSYQTADLAYSPDIAVFTSLYPEHGPWHGGHAQYFADKLRIADLQPAPRIVANARDARLAAHFSGREGVAWANQPGTGFHAGEGRVFFGEDQVDVTGFALKGSHNLDNLALAFAACEAAGVTAFRQSADLSAFAQLPHRLEEFLLPNGVVCVNDSISTVPETAIAALEAYAGRRVILILGGEDRGQDYSKLYPVLAASNLKAVLCLPATGRTIAEALEAAPAGCPAAYCATLEAAVRQGLALAEPGDVLILSPAAPSYGQFRNFEERGALFKQFCETLPG